jgi:hypothetical protein
LFCFVATKKKKGDGNFVAIAFFFGFFLEHRRGWQLPCPSICFILLQQEEQGDIFIAFFFFFLFSCNKESNDSTTVASFFFASKKAMLAMSPSFFSFFCWS